MVIEFRYSSVLVQLSTQRQLKESISFERIRKTLSEILRFITSLSVSLASWYRVLVKRGSEVVVARSVKSGGWCPLASLSCKREPPTIKLNSGRLQLKSMLGNRLTVVGLIEGAVQEQASRFV